MAQSPDNQSAPGASAPDQETPDGAERAGRVLGQWGSRVGRGLAAAAVRVREEVEDMWAEAQSIRRGERE